MARGFIKRYSPEEYRQRPVDFDPDLADKILRMISNGEFLPVICEDIDMPLPGDFLKWIDEDPALEKRYIDARRRGTEVNVDEMAAASEMGGKDIGLMNLRFNALKQHAQMTDPSRYGPRATLKVGEADEEGGIDYREEVRRKLADLTKKRRAQQAAQQKPEEPDPSAET